MMKNTKEIDFLLWMKEKENIVDKTSSVTKVLGFKKNFSFAFFFSLDSCLRLPSTMTLFRVIFFPANFTITREAEVDRAQKKREWMKSLLSETRERKTFSPSIQLFFFHRVESFKMRLVVFNGQPKEKVFDFKQQFFVLFF